MSIHQPQVPSSEAKRRGKGESKYLSPFLAILVFFGLAMTLVNLIHTHSLVHRTPFIDNFLNESLALKSRKSTTRKGKFTPLQKNLNSTTNNDGRQPNDYHENEEEHIADKNRGQRSVHKNGKMKASEVTDNLGKSAEYRLAGLNCDAYGGPSEDIAREMVYWEDIPSDAHFVSPFKKKNVPQYLTFDTDGGGWNNIRMAMETAIALAVAMGRTLVIPPRQDIAHMNSTNAAEDVGKEQACEFSFLDFFPLKHVSKEHLGLDIITMDEFLEKEGLSGNLLDREGQVIFPPGNVTNWDGEGQPRELGSWLRNNVDETIWDPDECMAVFPASANPNDIQALIDIKDSVERAGGFPSYEAFIGKPSAVNASAKYRMMENWAGRKRLCIYDNEMQNRRVIHFPHDIDTPGARLLVHFYAFLFFQDWRQDLWMKRFIRDHIRYVDLIQCAAARVVHGIRQRARTNGDENGAFDTFHIRRGDFGEWFTGTEVEADYIYNLSKSEIKEMATVYIATDEKNRSYFNPLAEHYHLLFLDDFAEELEGVNTNIYGMIEQLVAAKGRKFLGCWFSTFTGYINRLRGYHANRAHAPGYDQGILASWYYVVEGRWDFSRRFFGVKQPFHAREFPAAWRLIDTGIGELG